MTLVLDAGVTIHLADGTVLEASDEPSEDRNPRLKIYMRGSAARRLRRC